MELAGTALGNHADLAAGGAAILSAVARGEHLHLRGGVDVGDADAGSIGARTHHGGAVERDQALLRARTVDVDAVVQAEREGSHRLTTYDAGFDLGEVKRIAAVELDVLDLLLRDKLPDSAALGLHDVCVGLDRNGRGCVANLHRDVDAAADVRVNLDGAEVRRLEACCLDTHRVTCQAEIGDSVAAAFVGDRVNLCARCFVTKRDVRLRYQGTG